MRLSELFYSIQGEGKLSGVPSVFVRASGCNLRCAWCFDPQTPILRPDWSWTPIGSLRAGDEVLARTVPDEGRHGGLTATTVRHVARRVAPLVCVNGEVVCTPDHKFWLTGKGGARSGWREVSRCQGRPVTYLAGPLTHDTAAYEVGYLAGMADGDGTFWTLRQRRGYRRFRLAQVDATLLERYSACAQRAGFALHMGRHSYNGFNGPGVMPALWLTDDAHARSFEHALGTDGDDDAWYWGYVAGMIDAEGAMCGRALRIAQNPHVHARQYGRLCRALDRLGLTYTREPKGIHVHSSGGQIWRVLAGARPCKAGIRRGVIGRAPHGKGRIIEEIQPLGREGEVVTLTTDCGSYIAGGYVVKNCDSPYTSWDPEGENVVVDEIVRRVRQFASARHVVLTGGEPMIMPDIAPLAAALKDGGYHVTIETAATVYKPVAVDLASLSPKLSNSTPNQREGGRFALMHEQRRLNVPVIQQFIDASPDFQLKFVVSDAQDLREIEAVVGQLRGVEPADVLLMPEGIDTDTLQSRAAWIADVCKTSGFRYCPRLHIALYGNKRGT